MGMIESPLQERRSRSIPEARTSRLPWSNDRQAMRKIEDLSPAFGKTRAKHCSLIR